MAKLKLNKEEKELLDSYERGEWKSVKNLEQEIEKHRKYARQTLKKDKRVNIRISSMVLEELQTRAVEDGMPYQTLISSPNTGHIGFIQRAFKHHHAGIFQIRQE